VAEKLIFSGKEISFLRELIKQGVEFVLVGLSAAALQGAPVVTQDIDLWFKDLADPGIKKALKKVGGFYVKPIGLNPPMFAGEAVKLFDIVSTMHGLDSFDSEIGNCIKINLGKIQVPVLKLERIIKSKETVGREKDKIVLPVLKDAIETIRGLKKIKTYGK